MAADLSAARHEFAKRLGENWRDVADALDVPAHERRRFRAGFEAQDLWDWLQERNRITDLAPALRLVGRLDLADVLDIVPSQGNVAAHQVPGQDHRPQHDRRRRRVVTTTATVAFCAVLCGLGGFLLLDGFTAVATVLVLLGVVGSAALVFTEISRQWPARPARQSFERALTAWGPMQIRTDVWTMVCAQVRAAQSAPYRVGDVAGLPLATVYVHQSVEARAARPHEADEFHRPEPLEARSRDQVRLRPMPLAQPVSDVLSRHQHLVFEGGPGLGKSSLARNLVLEMARLLTEQRPASTPTHGPLVPVLLTARSLARHRTLPWAAAVIAAASDELGQHADDSHRADLIGSPPNGAQWLVIIDGLDEVVEPHRGALLEVIASRMSVEESLFRIIVTSRPLGDAARQRLRGAGAALYSLLPFTRLTLRDFAAKAFAANDPNRASRQTDRFLQQLRSSGFAEIASVPLFATIALAVFLADPSRGMPRTRAELYDEYLAHLGQLAQLRLRPLRARLRQQWSLVAGMGETIDRLFQVSDHLVEHLAIGLVDTDKPLLDVAVEWCVDQGTIAPSRAVAFRLVIAEVLTSTGVVVRRGSDLAFLHYTFAEHYSAAHHARQLPQIFTYDDPSTRTWIDRATTGDELGKAVLIRWSRNGSHGELLTWLQNGAHLQQYLAAQLIADGAHASDDHIARTLAYLEFGELSSVSADDVLSISRRLPRTSATRSWAGRVLAQRNGAPLLQAAAARMFSDDEGSGRVMAVSALKARLEDDLLPSQRVALADGLAGLESDEDGAAIGVLRRVVVDPLATPEDRSAAAQVLVDLGPGVRDRTRADLVRFLARPDLEPLDRASAARVLADLDPSLRTQLIEVARSALTDPEADAGDRAPLAQIAAELAGGDAVVVDALLTIATDVGADVAQRRLVARVLADSDGQRNTAATLLHAIAIDPYVDTYERRVAAASLAELGTEWSAQVGEAIEGILFDRTNNPWQVLQAARKMLLLPRQYLRRAHDRLRTEPEDSSDARRIAVLAALAILEPSYLPHAATTLRAMIEDQNADEIDGHSAACMLAELGPDHLQTAASFLVTQTSTAHDGWTRAYMAYWLSVLRPQLAPEGLRSIRDELDDPRHSPSARCHIASLMIEITPPDNPTAENHWLAAVLHDPNYDNFKYASGRLKNRSHITRAKFIAQIEGVAAADHSDSASLVRAALALAELGHRHRQHGRQLARSLMDDVRCHPRVRLAATNVLARTPADHDQALTCLELLAADQHLDQASQVEALLIADRIDPRGREGRRPRLRDLMADPDTPLDSVLRLVEWLGRVDGQTSVLAEALHAMLGQATDTLYDVCVQIGRYDSEQVSRAVHELQVRLSDPDETVETACAIAAVLPWLEPGLEPFALHALLDRAERTMMPMPARLSILEALLRHGQRGRRLAFAISRTFLTLPWLTVAQRIRALAIAAAGQLPADKRAALAAGLRDDPRLSHADLVGVIESTAAARSADQGARARLRHVAGARIAPYDARVNAALAAAALGDGPAEEAGVFERPLLVEWNDQAVAAFVQGRIEPLDPTAGIDALIGVARQHSSNLSCRWRVATALMLFDQARAASYEILVDLLDEPGLVPTDQCRVATALARLGPGSRVRAAAAMVTLLAGGHLTYQEICGPPAGSVGWVSWSGSR